MTGRAGGGPGGGGRGEQGQGGIEGVVFGVLVFVLGTLVVANAWGVVDAKLAATSAAREAARSYVEATTRTDALRAAEVAARDAIAGHARSWRRTTLDPPDEAFVRCARATVEVRYDVPLVAIPLLGQFGTGLTVSSRHSEVVDPYRSGTAGVAACDG